MEGKEKVVRKSQSVSDALRATTSDASSSALADLLRRVEEASGRFWKKVRIGEPEECWEWQAYCRAEKPRVLPYGRWTYVKGRVVVAHRAAWMLTRGPIGSGLCVCHHCDNPRCCNPNHLFLGTYGDNNRDRSQKGRTRRRPNEDGVRFAKGTAHGSSKLSEAQVHSIRRDQRTLREIAAEHGVSESAASRIKRGITWRHVPLDGDPMLRALPTPSAGDE